MTIDEQRREALGELRDQLADGVDSAVALDAAADASGLATEVIRKIGERLISSRQELVAARERDRQKADRKRRADYLIKVYRERLVDEPNSSGDAIDAEIGVADFSDDERHDLFNRKIDAWFDRNI